MLLVPLVLIGCSSVGSIAGAVVGAATGGATTNPVVGYAVGIGTKVLVDQLVFYIGRRRQQGEQDEIAAQVGALPIGVSAPWKIDHDIPIGNEHGDMTVVRQIDSPLATCREVVFTVVDGHAADSPRGVFVTTACQQGPRWKWAQAEPATARWGFLQ